MGGRVELVEFRTAGVRGHGHYDSYGFCLVLSGSSMPVAFSLLALISTSFLLPRLELSYRKWGSEGDWVGELAWGLDRHTKRIGRLLGCGLGGIGNY